MNAQLQTQPYKGARDFYPLDMRVQNYIFDTWKKICTQFGFEQYDFPVLEPLEIFAAKSGEELVSEQLFSFEDRGGRKVAVRPELTPGTVRLIAQKYKEITQPIKWFMIGNNWRYEKPQTGRGREFYQLEANIFGIEGIEADFEIFSLIISLMKEFKATEDMYEIRVSDRRLISSLLNDVLKIDNQTQLKTRRIMDKRAKMDEKDFIEALKDLGLTQDQALAVETFMSSTLENINIPKDNPGFQALSKIFEMLKQNGLEKSVRFDPAIIRGFDYSDKLVYEVYDKNPANRRSLFGGERFDNLIKIFGSNYDLPSTGFAMGDYTLLEFLKNWNLLPRFEPQIEYLVTLWPSQEPKYFKASFEAAQTLRQAGKSVFLWTERAKIDKQLKFADVKQIPYVVIIGEEELKNGAITVKNLNTKEQKVWSLDEFFSRIK